MKKVILVLGMGRSGTSACTGVLNLMGAYVGSDLLPPHSSNPKGFFENRSIFFLNEYIINNKLSSSWNNINDLNIDFNRIDILSIIEYVIISTYGDQPVIAIKDPRISLLLPYYQKVLSDLNYEIHYIRTHRQESDIVNSLMLQYNISEENSHLLIKKYNGSLDKYLPSQYINVHFDDLLSKTDSVISSMKHAMTFLNYDESVRNEINNFLDPSLKNL